MAIQRDLSREAYLWYTITSPDLMAHAKPLIQSAIEVLRAGAVQQPLAADYPPVPYWGGVMEDVVANFENALVSLQEGNLEPMVRQCARMVDVPRGFSEGVQWLEGSQNVRMLDFVDRACTICSDFLTALSMSEMFNDASYKSGSTNWHYEVPRDIGIRSNTILLFEKSVFEILGRPSQTPEYAADTSIICKTGEIVPWTGVWVPVTGMGTAALAFARQGVQVMQPAYELAREFAEGEYLEASKVVDTAWHPVKPTGRMIPLPPLAGTEASGPADPTPPASTARCESGQPCPQSGFWSTPASQNSRRRFMAGEIMPAVGGDYGATIWQWDASQE